MPFSPPASSDCIGAAPCNVAAGGQPDATLTPGTYKTYTNRVTGMQCDSCHTYGADMKGIRSDIGTLYVPPQKGAVGTNGVVSFTAAQLPPGFAVCASCHSGLENKASVDTKIGSTPEDSFTITSFVNPHYYGAAAIILGTEAKAMYEYAGKTYQGKAINWSTGANGPHGSPHGASCAKCHDPRDSKHSFEIDEDATVVDGTFYGATNTKTCNECHTGQYALAPAKANLAALASDLLTRIRYVAEQSGNPICYTPNAYPYWIKDNGLGGGTAGNGYCEPGEAVRTNGYNTFNPTLLRAAYNYQWFVKDPGAAEHNYIYMAQVLWDAIESTGMTPATARPVTVP
jgi:hypothetical protein